MNFRHHEPVIPVEREIITAFVDDDQQVYCDQFGPIASWTPTLQRAHGAGAMRPCVHRTHPMEPVVLFEAEWVLHLHWQLCLDRSVPVIASRHVDVVTLAFDVIGPVGECSHPVRHKPENRWDYRLYHLRWWDQDETSTRYLVGVAG